MVQQQQSSDTSVAVQCDQCSCAMRTHKETANGQQCYGVTSTAMLHTATEGGNNQTRSAVACFLCLESRHSNNASHAAQTIATTGNTRQHHAITGNTALPGNSDGARDNKRGRVCAGDAVPVVSKSEHAVLVPCRAVCPFTKPFSKFPVLLMDHRYFALDPGCCCGAPPRRTFPHLPTVHIQTIYNVTPH